jgi:hypothetical protein
LGAVEQPCGDALGAEILHYFLFFVFFFFIFYFLFLFRSPQQISPHYNPSAIVSNTGPTLTSLPPGKPPPKLFLPAFTTFPGAGRHGLIIAAQSVGRWL